MVARLDRAATALQGWVRGYRDRTLVAAARAAKRREGIATIKAWGRGREVRRQLQVVLDAKAAAGSGVAEQSERGPLRRQVDLTDTLLDCATLDDTTLHWVGAFVARGRRDTSTTRPRHACAQDVGSHLSASCQ